MEEDELSFKSGERIMVLLQDPEGWWFGVGLSGQRGYFPSSYVASVC